MNGTRIRELSLELNQLALEREADEGARRLREREILQEIVRLSVFNGEVQA